MSNGNDPGTMTGHRRFGWRKWELNGRLVYFPRNPPEQQQLQERRPLMRHCGPHQNQKKLDQKPWQSNKQQNERDEVLRTGKILILDMSDDWSPLRGPISQIAPHFWSDGTLVSERDVECEKHAPIECLGIACMPLIVARGISTGGRPPPHPPPEWKYGAFLRGFEWKFSGYWGCDCQYAKISKCVLWVEWQSRGPRHCKPIKWPNIRSNRRYDFTVFRGKRRLRPLTRGRLLQGHAT